MPYALCPMPYALCPMPYALCPMSNVLCPMSNGKIESKAVSKKQGKFMYHVP
jgi:hypothetical protein